MKASLFTHDAMRDHDPGPHHPERPARLEAALAGAGAAHIEVVRRTAPGAAPEALYTVHPRRHVERIHALCDRGGGALDPDTAVVPETWPAVLRAAGAGLAAVEELQEGKADMAFLAIRPPGHHATSDESMGFCVFNNIAITAAALAAGGERVAILDWDVHHGNGTQDIFYDDGEVLFLSLHEYPLYPGTGWLDEVGAGAGTGLTVNIPVPAATAGDVYRAAFERIVVPVITEYRPDWLLVSAGFDAHRDDPLAHVRLVDADFGWMAGALRPLVPNHRLLVFLEGGYDLDAIRTGTAAMLDGFAGSESEAPLTTNPQSPAWRLLESVTEVAGRFWEVR
jgi:acetoin utilization deacetylase AcuC-like enzyme